VRVLSGVSVALCALCLTPLRRGYLPLSGLYLLIPLLLAANILPYLLYRRIPRISDGRRHFLSPSHSRHSLRACAHGVEILHIFLLSTGISVICHLACLPMLWRGLWVDWLLSAAVAVGVLGLTFWNGMLCLYLYSVQLGIRWRVIGALCGLIPIAQLIVLRRIMKVVDAEVETECARAYKNLFRRDEAVCATRYPILMVHGVFFRDFKHLNYWGRIPYDLELNGATVYYGGQHSAAAVADCAAELADRIREIVTETGCGKVNVIAHSKGGLDMRYALQNDGVAPFVASLTTVNTPHTGCVFADFLLKTFPDSVKTKISSAYNKAAHRLGDPDPDFMAAVGDLTATGCAALEPMLAGDSHPEALEGIYCQSVGTLLPRARGGRFPLNLAFPIVRFFDGPNDGLVSETAFPFGEKYTLLTPTGDRGISHGDIIDLNRENIEGFDVREFYVELVKDLKERGL
jgi:triacylglycerol lipase